MELILLILIAVLLIVILGLSLMVGSVVARIHADLKTLRDSIQVLSEQLSDIEENQKITEVEIRKVMKWADRPWYNSV